MADTVGSLSNVFPKLTTFLFVCFEVSKGFVLPRKWRMDVPDAAAGPGGCMGPIGAVEKGG